MIIFCPECNNMLYPKEEKVTRKLSYACRQCGHKQPAQDPCIYRNEVLRETEDSKTVIVHDVSSDPTLPRTTAKCSKCDFKEACYFQSYSKADEKVTLFFVCANPQCGHRWKEEY